MKLVTFAVSTSRKAICEMLIWMHEANIEIYFEENYNIEALTRDNISDIIDFMSSFRSDRNMKYSYTVNESDFVLIALMWDSIITESYARELPVVSESVDS